MQFKALKNALKDQPFPQELKLTNGNVYVVLHPEFISVARRTTSIAIIPTGKRETEYHAVVATEHIVEVQPMNV